jgi:DNA-directed RNA polymerase subunit RPC12/RpoP
MVRLPFSKQFRFTEREFIRDGMVNRSFFTDPKPAVMPHKIFKHKCEICGREWEDDVSGTKACAGNCRRERAIKLRQETKRRLRAQRDRKRAGCKSPDEGPPSV